MTATLAEHKGREETILVPVSSADNYPSLLLDISASACDMSFNNLPTELRFQIFEQVACINNIEPPSLYRFAEEPTSALTNAKQRPLKDSSLVCKSWRALTAPLLFRHSRIVSLINREDLLSVEQAVFEYCDFAKRHRLGGRAVYEYVSTLTLVTNSGILAAAWPGIRSPMDGPDGRYVEIVADIWEELFGTLANLEKITLVAPVVTMAALLSTCEQTTETWVFNMPCHYLRLSIDPLPRGSKSLSYRSWKDFVTSTRRNTPTILSGIRSRLPPLVHAKDWRHLAYNEGAMISAYSHYEWQWKVPPKVLRGLLGQLIRKIRVAELKGQTSASLRSIEYISLFPLANHVETTFLQESRYIFDTRNPNNVLDDADVGTGQQQPGGGLTATTTAKAPTFPLHQLERFTLRLGDSDLLTDKIRMGHSDRTDCWSEWENSYRILMANFLTKLPEGAILRTLGGKEMEYAVEDVLTRYREETRQFKTLWRKRWADGLVWDKVPMEMRENGAEGSEGDQVPRVW